MATLGEIMGSAGDGLLGNPTTPFVRTCRYHVTTELIQVERQLSLSVPPPHQVIFNVQTPQGTQAQTSPDAIPVWAWYCPICTYLELHYVPAV